MPRGNGTGPTGAGPMTGRAAGYCAGYDQPGCFNPGPGMGMGYGYGRGRGRGFGMGMGRGYGRGFGWANRAWSGPRPPYYMEPTPQQEMDMLKQQAEAMKANLDQINQRIDQIQAESKG